MTVLLGLLTAFVVAGLVAAATPVTVGYRDGAIGGGVDRPTKDKPQSKLWFTDGSWFAGMFDSASNAYKIHRLDTTTHDWTPIGPELDTRNDSTGDYLWDEGTQTLWVASTHPRDTTVPLTDQINVIKISYNASNNTFGAATSVAIPGTESVTIAGEGGAVTVTIAKDSGGRLWAVWPRATQIRYSISDDAGATWSIPAQVPAQSANPVKDGVTTAADTAAVVAFGTSVGVMWSDHDDLPASTNNGFYFASIPVSTDPTLLASWTSVKLPSLVGADDGERADNHINMKVASDGTIYAVGKTGKDTVNCASNLDKPLIVFFKRTTGGAWTANLVSTAGDCSTRPQLVISEQLNVAYVFLTSPNGGGAVYQKSAPLSGPEALKFRIADTTIQRGTPFIQSATETKIDDPSTTKQVVTAASGIVVLANNISPEPRYYLHNEMAIGGAPDAIDPTGTVLIDGGAASTGDTVVSVAMSAIDTGGSGLSQVRLADSATVTGGVLSGSGATTFAYTTPIDWTVPTGDGSKTVYVQWRDAAGNWSAVASDSIILDAVPTLGSVSIASGATFATNTTVSVDVTATDAGSGVVSVRLADSASVDSSGVLNGAGAETRVYATPQSWTLPAGDGTKTIYVQWQDGNSVWSPVVSDSIILDATAPTGAVSLDGGAASTASTTVSVAVSATDAGSGLANVRLANSATVDGSGVLIGAGATTSAYSTPKTWTLLAGDGTKTVYVQWQDAAGNWSAVVSDSIVLDAVPTVGSVSIASGATFATNATVSVAVPATDAGSGVVNVRLANSAAIDGSGVLSGAGATTSAYSTPKTWTLLAGDGTKTVYVQWQDGNSVWSPVASDSIILDATAPAGTVSIAAGAVATVSATVSVLVPATDAGSGLANVRLADSASVDGSGVLNGAGATTSAYSTPKAWTLPAGDGTKTVYVQWQDVAGNWSAVASDSIDLDATGPTGTVSINSGATTTALTAVSVAVPATDPGSPGVGVASVRLSDSSSVSGGVLASGTTFAYTTPVSWTVPDGDGTKTVYVQWKDDLGNWSPVASDSIELQTSDSTFVKITPVRLVDTRSNNPGGITKFRHEVPQSFQITGRGGVPSGAVAITGNLTVVNQQRAGYVTLAPVITSVGRTSTLNFPLRDTRANGVVVPLGADGRLSAVYHAEGASPGGRTTHLLLDVTGYFVKGTTGSRYVALTPGRFLDTRSAKPAGAKILKPGVPFGFQVGGRTAGSTTVPANAVAITGNLTVAGQTAGGYLSLTPTSQSRPTTSTLNFPRGDTRANNVTVPLGAGGKLWVVYRGSGRAHAILDVTGYFLAGSTGMTYVPLTPSRIVDTRVDLGIRNPLPANTSRSFAVRGQGGVLTDAGAFTGNVTVTKQTRAGYITVSPSPVSGAPKTSTLNFPRNDTRANGLAGPIDGATGKASVVYRAPRGARVEFIVDITGYFH